MKKAILAGSIAGTLLIGNVASAHDQVTNDPTLVRARMEEQYRQRVSKNVTAIVEAITPPGLEFQKFDSRITVPGMDEKTGSVTRGLYYPLFYKVDKSTESGLYFGVAERVTSTRGLIGGVLKDKTVETQLQYKISF